MPYMSTYQTDEIWIYILNHYPWNIRPCVCDPDSHHDPIAPPAGFPPYQPRE